MHGTKQQQAAAKRRHELGKPHARGHCASCPSPQVDAAFAELEASLAGAVE